MAKKDFSKMMTGRTYNPATGKTETVQFELETTEKATEKEPLKNEAGSGSASKVFEEIETATAKRGQQGKASPEEQAERAAKRQTQGRKGCKLPGKRLNLLLTPENHDFIALMSRATGRTMTDYCNYVISAYKKEHPEFMAAADSFLKLTNAGEWKDAPKENPEQNSTGDTGQ